MSDLARILSVELVAAIEQVVDERVAAALADRMDASASCWLTIPEAAAYLRTSERTLQRLLKKRRIRATAIGRRRLLYRDELDVFMRATTEEEVAPTTPSRRRGE